MTNLDEAQRALGVGEVGSEAVAIDFLIRHLRALEERLQGSREEPLSAAALLAEQLKERLAPIPTRITTPADREHARQLFERAANWYFAYHGGYSDDRDRLELLSVFDLRVIRQMDMDEAEQICGKGIIHTRALLNLLGQIAVRVLGIEYDEKFTADQLLRGLHAWQLVISAAVSERKAELESGPARLSVSFRQAIEGLSKPEKTG